VSPRGRTAQERREAIADRLALRAAITDPNVVMEAAAAFLAVRPRSIEETRRRLRHLGYPSVLADEVVGRLVEMRYLDDADFARAWVESRDRVKPRGESALRRELRLKGVPDAIVADVLLARSDPSAPATGDDGHRGDADHDAAQRLLDRRATSLRRESDPRRRRQRAYALLARNGFAPDVCQAVSSRLVRQAQDESG
jgi:regulatory protein